MPVLTVAGDHTQGLVGLFLNIILNNGVGNETVGSTVSYEAHADSLDALEIAEMGNTHVLISHALSTRLRALTLSPLAPDAYQSIPATGTHALLHWIHYPSPKVALQRSPTENFI